MTDPLTEKWAVEYARTYWRHGNEPESQAALTILANALAARTSTATADTEPRCKCQIVGWNRDPYEPHIPVRAEWEQADDCPVHPLAATADGDLGMVCDAYGLPHNAVALARHIESNAALTIEVQKDTIRLLQERAATADTGLRERVEALADQWERLSRDYSLANCRPHRLSTHRAAGQLRAMVDATPASTEDRADNEGTR